MNLMQSIIIHCIYINYTKLSIIMLLSIIPVEVHISTSIYTTNLLKTKSMASMCKAEWLLVCRGWSFLIWLESNVFFDKFPQMVYLHLLWCMYVTVWSIIKSSIFILVLGSFTLCFLLGIIVNVIDLPFSVAYRLIKLLHMLAFWPTKYQKIVHRICKM